MGLHLSVSGIFRKWPVSLNPMNPNLKVAYGAKAAIAVYELSS